MALWLLDTALAVGDLEPAAPSGEYTHAQITLLDTSQLRKRVNVAIQYGWLGPIGEFVAGAQPGDRQQFYLMDSAAWRGYIDFHGPQIIPEAPGGGPPNEPPGGGPPGGWPHGSPPGGGPPDGPPSPPGHGGPPPAFIEREVDGTTVYVEPTYRGLDRTVADFLATEDDPHSPDGKVIPLGSLV